jgi:ABC-type nitrate/sulfonate/bicarbonate transport system substrate-binding protein
MGGVDFGGVLQRREPGEERKMTRTRKWRIVIAAFLFFLGIGRPAGAQIKMKAGYASIATGFAALWVAKEKGFFLKNGLDMELIVLQGGVQVNQALLAGSVEVGVGGGSPAIEGNLQGLDVVIISSLRKVVGFPYLVTVKEITRAEQLKGKTLGIDRYGDASDILLRWALRRIGLDPDKDVTIRSVAGGSSARALALQAGQIQGALVNAERAFMLSQRVGANVILDLTKSEMEFLTADVVATRRAIKEQEDGLRRFMRSVVEGIHFVKTYREPTIEVMAKYLRNADQKIIEVGYQQAAEHYLKKPYPAVNGVRFALENLTKNPKAKQAKAEQFVDDRFIRDLDESGFIDGLYAK